MRKVKHKHGIIANFSNIYSKLCELFGSLWHIDIMGYYKNEELNDKKS